MNFETGKLNSYLPRATWGGNISYRRLFASLSTLSTSGTFSGTVQFLLLHQKLRSRRISIRQSTRILSSQPAHKHYTQIHNPPVHETNTNTQPAYAHKYTQSTLTRVKDQKNRF